MASTFRHSFTLIDTRAQKTTLNYESRHAGLTVNDDFDEAYAANLALQVALEAVTDANVYSKSLTWLGPGTTALPADADISDELAIVTFLTAEAAVPKYATLRVPAPIEAVWESDNITLDETNQAVIDFVAEVADGFVVSDGETIVTANSNGISHGYWRSKALSTN